METVALIVWSFILAVGLGVNAGYVAGRDAPEAQVAQPAQPAQK